MIAQEIEIIYDTTMDEYKRISHFNSLTSYTYELALASAENNKDKLKIPNINMSNINIKKIISYSSADVKIEGTELARGWISLKEYAEKTGMTVEITEKKSLCGELGEVRKKNGIKVVFWPPSEQGNEALPPVDCKNSYKVNMKITGTASLEQDFKLEDIIAYLGPADKLVKKTSEAIYLLNRETFLLYWSTFEQYIKNITFTLFELFPDQVFNNKRYVKNQMSYIEIFEKSSKFTSIQDLKEFIINSIIGNPNTERESISKQISFIQDCYFSKNESPYDTWYVLNGEKQIISYQVLDQIRILRNALVHKAGYMREDWEKIDIIDKPEDNHIVVDSSLLIKTELILRSVSYNIYRLIKKMVLGERNT